VLVPLEFVPANEVYDPATDTWATVPRLSYSGFRSRQRRRRRLAAWALRSWCSRYRLKDRMLQRFQANCWNCQSRCINNCSLLNNSSVPGTGGPGEGGAIFTGPASTLTATNSTLSGNIANSPDVGTIYSNGNVTITNSTFAVISV
jgi:hypothetical protein